jgi:hypothetical protein
MARQQETNVEGMKKVLSLEVDGDTESEDRIQVNNQVKYIVVQPGIYDFDDILFPTCSTQKSSALPTGQLDIDGRCTQRMGHTNLHHFFEVLRSRDQELAP